MALKAELPLPLVLPLLVFVAERTKSWVESKLHDDRNEHEDDYYITT